MDKIKVAVVGCGTIANSAHIPAYLKNEETEIRYFCDIIPSRADMMVRQYECGTAVYDYHELLDDPEIKAVSVCTPNHVHAQISIDFLKAGKDVLCEKPAAMNYAEALEMKAIADKCGRILNIGVVNRFNTGVNKIRDMIQADELGEVYHIYCSFRSYRSIPGLGGQFTSIEKSGGGVLIDWGVHFLDLINYCINSPIIHSVSGASYSRLGKNMKEYVYTDMWAGPPDYSGKYDVEEFITGIIRTDGPTITLNGAWAQNINENAMFIEFMGDKAGIKLQYGGNFTLYGTKNGMLTQMTSTFKTADMFYDEIDAFIHCAIEGKKIRSNIDEVLMTAKMMDGLYKSAATGREVVYQ